jgi:hypothetical protein
MSAAVKLRVGRLGVRAGQLATEPVVEFGPMQATRLTLGLAICVVTLD